jgi:hypothetical protein
VLAFTLLPDQIFFQSIDNKLWVMTSDGRGNAIRDSKTASTPFAF